MSTDPQATDIVLAELVDVRPPDDATAFSGWRQARLTWISAILAATAAAALLVFQIRLVTSGTPPMGWLFLPLGFFPLVSGIWGIAILFRYGRQRGILGHAVTGLLMNAAVLVACLLGCAAVYGAWAVREAQRRPPQHTECEYVVSSRGEEPPEFLATEPSLPDNTTPPDAGKVLESSLDPHPLATRPVDIEPESVDAGLMRGEEPVNWGRWVVLGLYGRERRECVWSADGNWLFVIQDDAVQQISVPGFQINRKLRVIPRDSLSIVSGEVDFSGYGRRSISSFPRIVLTKNGLVVGRPASHDMLLLDPKTLAVKQCISLAATLLVGSAELPYVVAANSQVLTSKPYYVMDVMFVDIGEGRMLSKFKVNMHYDALAVTPDGRYLFGRSDNPDNPRFASGSFVHRYAIHGHEIAFNQSSAATIYDGEHYFVVSGSKSWWNGCEEPAVYFSHDSQHLAMRPVGHHGVSPQTAKHDCGIGLYSVAELEKPHEWLSSPQPIFSMTSDPRTGDIYALTTDAPKGETFNLNGRKSMLRVYTPQGALKNAIRLPGQAKKRWILADPLGRGLLVGEDGRVNWLRFPRQNEAAADANPDPGDAW